MKDEKKTKQQLIEERPALGQRVEEATIGSRPWLPIACMFVLICIFLWLNEILDLPHLLLGASPTAINWRELLVETIVTAIVGFLAVSVLIRHITQRLSLIHI